MFAPSISVVFNQRICAVIQPSVSPLLLLASITKHDPVTARAMAVMMVRAGVSVAQVDHSLSNVLHNTVSLVSSVVSPFSDS